MYFLCKIFQGTVAVRRAIEKQFFHAPVYHLNTVFMAGY